MKNLIILIVSILLETSFSVQAEEIHIVTEEFPPFQYEKNDKIVGMATELVRTTLDEAGIRYTLEIYPWPRAYDKALLHKNVLIYSMSRSEQREKLFKWVGVVAPLKNYFFKLKDRRDIRIKTLEDAKRYDIGTVRDDNRTQFLVKHGFMIGQNIEQMPSDTLNIRKLFKKRIDILPIDEASLYYRLRDLGFETSKVEKAFYIKGLSNDLYMAFSLKTDNAIVEKTRRAWKQINQDGRYKRIKAKYVQ